LCSIFETAKFERIALPFTFILLKTMHPQLKPAALVLAGVFLTQIAAILPATAETSAPAAVQGNATQTASRAARELIARLLPKHADRFICEVIPNENGKDVFELESRDGKILLRGNNGLGIASALNWYLEKFCHCQVSSCGSHLNLPDSLPIVPAKVRKVSPHQYRYTFNYCTFGYTMAFWDWERWEREIDFMALQGINAPLAVTGAEVIYRNVYRDLGLSDEEIGQFIAAPPFLPWFFMNNIDAWGGPNPESWYVRQEALQKKILARQRELGMKPIQTTFNGHVPAALGKKFPASKIHSLRGFGFPGGVKLLDPGDPLFRNLGARFIKETRRLYGADHLYSADVFNEVHPPSGDPAYLKDIGSTVYQSMAEADPEAIWFMQGWLFIHDAAFWTQPRIEAMLSGVPDDRMVIIDLFSDGKPQWQRTKAYCGKPWLWCIINNWGGKQGMYGRMTQVGDVMPKLLGKPEAGRLSGIGTVQEGSDNNPIVYHQVNAMAWLDQPMDVPKWVESYVLARYGKSNESAMQAWKIIHQEIYECRDTRHGPPGSFLAMIPTLSGSGDGSAFARSSIFYNTRQVREAFRLLLAAGDELGHLDTYRHDVVDLGRQVMGDIAQQKLHPELRAAHAAKDAKRFDLAATAYYDAITDCDRLLRTHTMFQLGRYLQYPRRAGSNDAENAKWENNARRLITLWGGNLSGYAQRQYGGLMADFNLPCWKAFLGSHSRELHGDKSKSPETVKSVTDSWIKDRKTYPVAAEGNAVAVAREILRKYCPVEKPKSGTLTPVEFVGRWVYQAEGATYVREFREDGSLHLFVNGKSSPGWKGYTWAIEGAEIILRKADGTVFGKHSLRDAQTLLFVTEPYGPAVREIRDIE
jgi:alpha-N-acetylglucosaminidase